MLSVTCKKAEKALWNLVRCPDLLWVREPNYVEPNIHSRVSHITPFFELSLVLLTTHAIGLYEVTKKNSAL